MGKNKSSRKGAGNPGGHQNPQQIYQQAQYLQQHGRLAEAEKLYRSILKSFPDHPDVIHYLGLLFAQKGEADKACQYFEKSIQLQPNNPVFYSNYGMLFSRQRQFDRAIDCFNKALQQREDYPEAWFNLGYCQSELGDLQAAESAYRNAARLKPDYVKALFNLACVQESLGHAGDAAETIKRLQQINPDNMDIDYTLGLALARLGGSGNIRRAHEYLLRAINVNPHSLEARLALARTLREGNNLEDARQWYEKILDDEPQHQEARIEYVNCLIDSDEPDRATEILMELPGDNRNNIPALSCLAKIDRVKGRFDSAKEHYHQILQSEPLNTNALFGLASSQKITDESEDLVISALKAAERKKDALGFFALGKIYNDLKDYDRSFEYYNLANAARNKRIEYSIDEHARYVDRIIELFNGNFIHRLKGNGNDSELPVFILGTPRSGTTLTEQIISSHSDVMGGGELGYIANLARGKYPGQTHRKAWPERILELAPESLNVDAAIYLDRIGNDFNIDGAIRFTDKMPANFFYIGYILALFPNARIIHCKRHPVDSCLSIYFQNFNAGHKYSFDLKNLGYWYRDYHRLMQHWKSLYGDRILDVHYHDTVTHLEDTARKLVRYCDLDWQEQCVEFHKTERAVTTASHWQVRQKIYSSSLERWRRYEKHIPELLDILSDLIEH